MPEDNQFQHQKYTDDPPSGEWQLVRATPPGAEELTELWHSVATRLSASGVAAIYLVHGTFVGDDALGVLRVLGHIRPALAQKLRKLQKQAVDALAKDAGNYTPRFAGLLRASAPCPVNVFRWSSENNHIARAHAAITLIHDLIERGLAAEQRVLCWGHSHAGNVFALVTNLLAAERSVREHFFRVCGNYYRKRHGDTTRWQVWQRVHSWLDTADIQRDLPRLDFVTFGTPIRYGWDAAGYAKLLHIVHHHPREDLPPYLTCLPHSIDDVLAAVDGDYVQHWGIAGSNLAPTLLPFGTWLADRRLGRFLQRNITPRGFPRRLKIGQRVPADGKTLLVDYGRSDGKVTQQMAGHAVYTRSVWLAFHARLVCEHFYGQAGDVSAAQPPRDLDDES